MGHLPFGVGLDCIVPESTGSFAPMPKGCATLTLRYFVLRRLFGYCRQLEGALSAIERHIGNTINIRFQRTVQMGAWTDPSSTVSCVASPVLVGVSWSCCDGCCSFRGTGTCLAYWGPRVPAKPSVGVAILGGNMTAKEETTATAKLRHTTLVRSSQMNPPALPSRPQPTLLRPNNFRMSNLNHPRRPLPFPFSGPPPQQDTDRTIDSTLKVFRQSDVAAATSAGAGPLAVAAAAAKNAGFDVDGGAVASGGGAVGALRAQDDEARTIVLERCGALVRSYGAKKQAIAVDNLLASMVKAGVQMNARFLNNALVRQTNGSFFWPFFFPRFTCFFSGGGCHVQEVRIWWVDLVVGLFFLCASGNVDGLPPSTFGPTHSKYYKYG